MSVLIAVPYYFDYYSLQIYLFYFILFRFYLFIFRERGREGEREGEKHQCVVTSHVPRTGDLAHNPGMCPAWEANQQCFGSQAQAQSTELHQSGMQMFFVYLLVLSCERVLYVLGINH